MFLVDLSHIKTDESHSIVDVSASDILAMRGRQV